MTTAQEPPITAGPAELETLLAEIRRYLDAVDVFRLAGHEPSWRSETAQEVHR
jgi:hypothetical protein